MYIYMYMLYMLFPHIYTPKKQKAEVIIVT